MKRLDNTRDDNIIHRVGGNIVSREQRMKITVCERKFFSFFMSEYVFQRVTKRHLSLISEWFEKVF